MCGIAGFYAGATGLGRPTLQALGRRMNDTLRHRGPDAQDIWQDPDCGMVLAHRRLSIIDLSPEGKQPMASASDRYILVYNGEIYNYLELKAPLERAGVKFRGRSDTEVLLALIESIGLNQALQKINGMFAFALWDRKTRTLHLARDRFGKKPLYVGWAGKSLVFGSELKALRAHPDFAARVNAGSRALYMKYGYVPAPHSIYEKVWSLPAGHRLTIPVQTLLPGEDLSEAMEPHWHHLRALEEAKLKFVRRSDTEAVEEFSELLKTSVRDRLMSDVPLGAFLSGGIDSSAVVGVMQSLLSQPVKTYTIGFHESGYDEAAYAKKIAAHLGTDHHEIYLSGADALNVIPHLPDIYDEPFADISAIPTYLVAKFARQGVMVALSGDGGDEMLGGYNRHISAPKIWARARFMPKPLRKLLASQLNSISTQTWDSVSHRPQFGSAVHKAASILALDTQEEAHDILAGQNADDFLARADMAQTILDDSEWQAGDLTFAEQMMYRDTLFYLPNDILVKVDRATMACSLEARAPLLDYRIYDYAWQLPQTFKIRNGRGKWLLRQALKRYVPEKYFERPKQGFAMPVAEWLRGPLRMWAEDMLTPAALGDEFNADAVTTQWKAHLKGRGNYAGKLWTLLMYQAWKKRWSA